MPGDVYSLRDGIIEPSDASPIGFSSDVFTGSLFKRGRDIWISLISVYPSKQNRGYFTGLLRLLTDAGYRVRVCCPSRQMRGILDRRGFTLSETCRHGVCMKKPDPRSWNERAKQNGAFIEGLFSCSNSGHIIDDPVNCIELKSCQEFIHTTCSNGSRRCGRFKFSRGQHEELIRREGRYRLVVHDGSCRILHQVLVDAREIDHLVRPTYQKKWPYFFPGSSAGGWPATIEGGTCTP